MLAPTVTCTPFLALVGAFPGTEKGEEAALFQGSLMRTKNLKITVSSLSFNDNLV